jgi:Leucine-rich repeat (LRR) protein
MLKAKKKEFLTISIARPYQSIQKEIFNKLANLKMLDLSTNFLSSIDIGAFEVVNKLSILYLSSNQFAQIERGTFNSLVNLEKFDLSWNLFGLIHLKAFRCTKSLRTLFLQGRSRHQLIRPLLTTCQCLTH